MVEEAGCVWTHVETMLSEVSNEFELGDSTSIVHAVEDIFDFYD
jgi:hypothetical protein